MTGSMNISDAAICRFHSTPRWIVVNCDNPTDSVQMRSLLPLYRSGPKKSFQQ